MPGKRQQPKRKVLEVERTGAYPNVWWEHSLTCGHIEKRKRKAPANQIACEKCARAAGLVHYDEDAAIATYEQQIAAKFARQFQSELVDVTAYSDGGILKVATVTLHLYREIT